MEMVIRIDGAIEQLLNRMVKVGYFKTKNEAIRAGLLGLGKEFGLLFSNEELEAILVIKKLELLEQDRKTGKRKTISISEMKNKYPELAILE